MSDARPASLEAYLLASGSSIALPEPSKFNINVGLIERTVNQSPFMVDLDHELVAIANEYSTKPGLMYAFPDPAPALVTKSHASMADKVFRENCVYNKNWPKPPSDGFINGTNVYARINDLVRGRITCRYLDGPELVAKAMTRLATKYGLYSTYKQMATDRGYYAWHFYVTIPCDLIVASEVEVVEVTLELQITTQLAELLTYLTHDIYSSERAAPAGPKDNS